MMRTHWVPVPYWDEWRTPGRQLASYYRGTLSFAELFSQHNESRKLFPRLLYLPLSISAGWDVRHYMVLTFAWVCVGSAGLWQIVRHSSPSARVGPFVFAAMCFVLFSPRQYENFLYGLQLETFTPSIALIFAILMNLSDRSLKTKTLVNAALAFVSTYTFANGMLLWLLAFPIETAIDPCFRKKPARMFCRAAYVVMATAAVAAYFISYRRPAATPPFVWPHEQPFAFVHFVLVWIGSLFIIGAPAICGAIVLSLFGVLGAAAFLQMRRTGRWRPQYPWLVLGCFTIMSGCAAAMGRLGFEHSMAGDMRYAAFSAFLYIAVLGLGFTVYTQTREQPRISPIALSAAIVCFAIILASWAITFKKERRLLQVFTPARKHLLLVLRWSEAIPKNPEIALLSPYPVGEVLSTIRTLAEHDVLRPRLVGQKLANAVSERPNVGAMSNGVLDAAKLEATGEVTFAGWARIPDQDRAADCIVLGAETSAGEWRPLCVVETGRKRPDVSQYFGSRALARAGFFLTVSAIGVSSSDVTVRAWAIDLQNERAFPMAGAFKLQAPPPP